MTAMQNRDRQEEQYRTGALVIGPETDAQEELERAKAGLPSLASERRAEEKAVAAQMMLPKDQEQAVPAAPPVRPTFGLVIKDAEEAVEIWADYKLDGAERGEILLPGDLSNPSKMVGDTIPKQVAGFVEETVGYRMIEATLRAENGLPWPYERPPFGGVTREQFMADLQERLPYEFLPPRYELCPKEIEEFEQAMLKASAAAIDERYRRRHPGFFK